MQRTIHDLSDKELVEYFTESTDPNNLMKVAGMILNRRSASDSSMAIADDFRIISASNFLRSLGIDGIDDYETRRKHRDDIVNAVADKVAASQSWLGSVV